MECGQQRVMKQEMSFGFGQGLFKRFRPEETVAVEEIWELVQARDFLVPKHSLSGFSGFLNDTGQHGLNKI